MRICELLPHHAKVSNRFSLLRSMVHTGFCHQQGTQQLLTGHPVRILKQKPDHPDLFSIVHRLRRSAYSGLPNYVGVNPVPYAGAAYLGPAYEPFAVTGDPQRERVPGAQHRAQDKQKLARKARTDWAEAKPGSTQPRRRPVPPDEGARRVRDPRGWTC
ncbi:MAG: hypothetical protein Ct9H300mP1_04930 [Planctomycetaceae bacterium]|nr:MAG: hypothetical protein Ct9H300mP1_04930 [Planctomycetaceae bacterium]